MKALVQVPAVREACRAAAAALEHRLELDFHGCRVTVSATSAAPLAYLRRVYAYFVAHFPLAAEPRRMLLLEEGSAAREEFLDALGERAERSGHLVVVDWFDWGFLLAGEAMVRYYSSKLLRLGVVEQLSGEYLTLHGASLESAQGDGLLLIGEAAAGKTSLTLRLLERGFRYAADDTTCIRRRDGVCVPFPMAFLVRADLTTGAPALPELRGLRPDVDLLDEPRWLVERWQAVACEFRPCLLVFLGGDRMPPTPPGELRPLPPSAAALEILRNVVFPLGSDLSDFDAGGADMNLAVDLVDAAECLYGNAEDLGRTMEQLEERLGRSAGQEVVA